VELEPDAEFLLPVPEGHTVVAYLFDGDGYFGVDDDGVVDLVSAVKMVVFGDGDHVKIRAAEGSKARFMLMAGGPFKEPIFPYGPFVMNTREEIQLALTELRNGTFVKV
jgi:redox-sensitive bicupin YhaK (pirin superfamily)